MRKYEFLLCKNNKEREPLKNLINFFELCKCFGMKLMKNCTIKNPSTYRNQICHLKWSSHKTTFMPESIHDIGTPYRKSTTHSFIPLSLFQFIDTAN